MGDFDDSIAWCRERRQYALDDIKDYTTGGNRQFRNDIDVTDEIVARAKEDVLKFDILIAAYEAHNAKSP